MGALRWMLVVALLPALGAGAAPAELTVHLDRPAASVSSLLARGALPAPGTPGAAGLLPELLRNASFEMAPPGKPLPLPKAWGEVDGWDYLSCGARRMVVRRTRGRGRDVLLLAPATRWGEYRLSLIARKIDGPGGFSILFEASDARTHLRWTLGALGNRRHVLEKVLDGRAEQLGQPVVGRIEAGRCYKLEVSRAKKVAQFAIDGRLIHTIRDKMPRGGIGLADGDATAEYFDVAVYGRQNRQRYMLDHPAEARRPTLAAHWHPLCDPRNDVGYRWDLLYPANSYLSQSIVVRKYVGGDAGLCQHGVPVAAGTSYRGRLWVRASGTAGVVVSLRGADGTVYARQALGEPSDVWRAFDFALTPSATDRAADFCITATQGGIVWVDRASLVAEGSVGAGGLARAAADALRRQRPALVWWPAGPAARHYNWRNGVGPREARSITSVVGGRAVFEPAPNAIGTAEALALCKAVEAEPVLVVNPVRGLRPALYWLEYCNGAADSLTGKLRVAHGRPEPYGVARWAIAGMPFDQVKPELYAERAAAIAEAMREQDPAVRVLPLLWDSHAMAERVAVEGGPAQLEAIAARDGDGVVVRLAHLGERAAEVVLAVRGLDGRRVAGQAEQLHIGADARLVRGRLAVERAAVRLSVRPWTAHVVVLRLEGVAQ